MSVKDINEYALAAALEKRLLSVQKGSFPAATAETIFPAGAAASGVAESMVMEASEVNPEQASLIFDEVDSYLSQIEQIAAVSGKFQPEQLPATGIETTVSKIALSRLSYYCRIEKFGNTITWMLHQEKRSEILKTHVNEKTLHNLATLVLPPTDLFGEFLRRIIFQQAIELGDLSQQDASILYKVLETLNDIDIPKPDPELVKERMAKKELMDDYSILLDQGFVGREKEMQELFDLVQKPSTYAGFILHGVGGSGKTTLLAKFILEVMKQDMATVAILDFDKPGIDINDPSWLELEITRQVGNQYPDLKQEVKHLIQSYRRDKEEEGAVSLESSEQHISLRGQRNIISDIALLLHSANPGIVKPFLLILDTCEEVTQQNITGLMIDWVEEIGSRIYPIPLKQIYSGRLYEREIGQFGHYKTLHIDEFDPVLAKKYLTVNLGLPVPIATQISQSKMLPRRPLELKLIAKLVTGKKKVTVKELEKDMMSGGKSAKDLFIGIVYRRVLNRIQDESIKTLAYPGLVLRYITPDLVREVLIPALGLDLMSQDEISKVLNGLASYGWLAYQDGEKVWHRKDLRRSMLRLMIARDPRKAKKISEKAFTYFNRWEQEDHRYEAIYHYLLMMQKPRRQIDYDLHELRNTSEYLGADVIELPKPASVLLKYATEGKVSVTEMHLLPDRFLAKAYDKTGQRLVKSGEYQIALELYKRSSSKELKRSVSDNLKNFNWEVETLATTASWQELQAYPLPEIEKGEPLPLPVIESYAHARQYHLRPEPTHFRQVAEAVSFYIADQGSLLSRDTRSPEAIRAFSRLTSYFVWTYPQVQKTLVLKRSLQKLQSAFEKHRKGAELPWTLQRNFHLLGKLGVIHRPQQFFLIPAMIKLDPEWMSLVYKPGFFILDFNSEIAEFSSKALQVMNLANTKSEMTVRKLLGSVDALSSRFKQKLMGMSIRKLEKNKKMQTRFLRGPDPEFRDPMRYAVMEAFHTKTAYKKLAEIISRVTRIRTMDLVPGVFAETVSLNPEQTLKIYMELVDRCWATGNFLRLALRYKPTAKKLKQVRNLYFHWNKIINQLLTK